MTFKVEQVGKVYKYEAGKEELLRDLHRAGFSIDIIHPDHIIDYGSAAFHGRLYNYCNFQIRHSKNGHGEGDVDSIERTISTKKFPELENYLESNSAEIKGFT